MGNTINKFSDNVQTFLTNRIGRRDLYTSVFVQMHSKDNQIVINNIDNIGKYIIQDVSVKQLNTNGLSNVATIQLKVFSDNDFQQILTNYLVPGTEFILSFGWNTNLKPTISKFQDKEIEKYNKQLGCSGVVYKVTTSNFSFTNQFNQIYTITLNGSLFGNSILKTEKQTLNYDGIKKMTSQYITFKELIKNSSFKDVVDIDQLEQVKISNKLYLNNYQLFDFETSQNLPLSQRLKIKRIQFIKLANNSKQPISDFLLKFLQQIQDCTAGYLNIIQFRQDGKIVLRFDINKQDQSQVYKFQNRNDNSQVITYNAAMSINSQVSYALMTKNKNTIVPTPIVPIKQTNVLSKAELMSKIQSIVNNLKNDKIQKTSNSNQELTTLLSQYYFQSDANFSQPRKLPITLSMSIKGLSGIRSMEVFKLKYSSKSFNNYIYYISDMNHSIRNGNWILQITALSYYNGD